MRRFIAFLVLWAGLLGAGSPAFACATAAAAGDCCPPGAPGCTQAYEQVGIEATVCCITAAAPAQMVSAERGRELQAVQDDCRSTDSVATVNTSFGIPNPASPARFNTPDVYSALRDDSLIYLRTGRLRL